MPPKPSSFSKTTSSSSKHTKKQKCHYTITHYICTHRCWSSPAPYPAITNTNTVALASPTTNYADNISTTNQSSSPKGKITHHQPCPIALKPNAPGAKHRCTNMATKPKQVVSKELCPKCAPPLLPLSSPPLRDYDGVFKTAFDAAAKDVKDGAEDIKGKSNFIEDLPPIESGIETVDLKNQQRGWVNVNRKDESVSALPEAGNGEVQKRGFMTRLFGKKKRGEDVVLKEGEGEGPKKGDGWCEVGADEKWDADDGEWESVERGGGESPPKGKK